MTGSLHVRRGVYHAVLNQYDKDGNRKRKWVNTKLVPNGRNKKQAEKILRELIVAEENKIVSFSDNSLFADYILEWLEGHKNKVELSTWEAYEYLIRKYIVPYFKKRKIKLQDLNQRDIKKYYQYLSKEGLSASSIRHHHANIRKSLKDAMIDELISRNVADLVQLPKKVKYVAKYYKMKQILKLIKAAKDDPLETAIILASNCGLRRSEVAGLKWDAIDMENKTITIRRTVVEMKTLVEKERTKTQSSYRTMPLTKMVYENLKALRRKQKENKLFFGSAYNDNDYVCKWEDGRPLRPNYYSQHLKFVIKRAGLPDIRFHDLRHSCARMLRKMGFRMEEIQAWLGHSEISTTANIYAPEEYEEKENMAKAMSEKMVI